MLVDVVGRPLFIMIGFIALLAGAGQVQGALAGSRLDWSAAWGLGLGLGSLAAAGWVRAQGGLPAAAAWAGIGAVVATCLWPLYYLITHPDSGPDVIALAVIPSAIGLGASFVMAREHWRARQAC